MTDSPPVRTRTGFVYLFGVLTLLLASRAWAQEQDLSVESLRLGQSGADLSLPDDRGSITTQFVVFYDRDGALPRRVTARLSLVARINGFTFRQALDQVAVDPRQLTPRGEVVPPTFIRVSTALDPEDIRTFLVQRGTHNLTVEVTVEGDGIVEPRGGGLPNLIEGAPPRIRPLSGGLEFGLMPGVLTDRPVDNGGCGAGLVRLNPQNASLIPSPNGQWDNTPIPADACAELVGVGAAFDVRLAGAFDEPVSFNGEAGGNAVTISGFLRHQGFWPLFVRLDRDDMTFHANRIPHGDAPDSTAFPYQIGLPFLLIGSAGLPLTGDLATVSLSRPNTWIRSRNLPFSIRATIRYDQSGFSGEFDTVHPIERLPMANTDPRRFPRGRATNAHYFDTITRIQPDETIRILPGGLQATVRFQGGLGKTHFPEMQSLYGDFDVILANGRLRIAQPIPLSSFSFGQSGTCPGCDAEADNATGYNVASDGPAGMGADGAILARVTGLPDDGPGFGPVADRGPDRHPVFQRFEDGERGVLQVPGFSASGTGNIGGDVTGYLLASREMHLADALAAPGSLHVFDAEALRGNHFFPGITVGPQIYSDRETAQPSVGAGVDLRGTRMWIGFGGAGDPDWRTVAANAGTKYVVRRGGLTGVFNTDAPPQPNIYGYPTTLSRFGFRVVANAIDDRTWIDGRVSVPGRGGFDLDVLDLDLTCSGHVDAGALAGRDCERDINCDHALSAWRAPYDIGGFDFPPVGDGLCAPDPRQLRTMGIADVHALRDPLGLTALWTPAGDPEQARITGGNENMVDGTADAEGFPVVLHQEVSLDSPAVDQGWFTFFALSPVPFWEAMRTIVRAENGEGGAARRTFLVANRDGQVPAEVSNLPSGQLVDHLAGQDDLRPNAHYVWGGTGFELDLPMRYGGKPAPNAPPRYLGDSLDYDLKVLTARAGVDWIDPERTRISFGASADFEKVRAAQVDLHLDLNDPNSVARADTFLDEVLPGNQIDPNGDGPIARTLGAVRGLLPSLMKHTGGGFDAFLEDIIRRGIRSIQAEIDQATNALSTVQALTSQISHGLLDAPATIAAELKANFTLRLAASLEIIWQELPAIGAQVNLGALPNDVDLQARLVDLVPEVQRIESAILYVLRRLDDDGDSMLKTLRAAEALLTRPQDPQHPVNLTATAVANARARILTLKARLAAVDVLTICAPDDTESFIFEAVDTIRTEVEQITDAVANNPLVQLAVAIVQISGIDLSAVQAAQTELADAARQVRAEVVEGIERVEARITQACALPQSEELLAFADRVLDDAITALDSLDAEVQLFVPQLGTFLGLAIDAFERLSADLRTTLNTLAGWARQLEALKVDFTLQFPIPGNLAQIQEALDALVTPHVPGGRFYVSAELNLVATLRARIVVPIEDLLARTIEAVQVLLADTIDQIMVLPTPEELVEILVERIMRSDIVAAVDEAVHDSLAFVYDAVDGLVARLLNQINFLVKEVSSKLTAQINDALEAAAGAINAIPISSARMDGYATIRGDDLERLHIDAEWTLRGDGDDNSSTYEAAFDMTSWTTNHRGENCLEGVERTELLDVVISAYNLPLTIGASEAIAREVFLGFTLRSVGGAPAPIAVFGGVDVAGDIDFEAFTLTDLGFQAGVGADEAYIGATGAASFDSISLEAGFLVGVTCDTNVLESLDPQVAEFLDLQEGFAGVYVRGGASIPVWDNGCALSVGVSADAGAWLLWETAGFRIGGLVGGGAWGEALCIAALRGQVTALAESQAGTFRFRGEGFGVAGLGFDCDPGTWTTVARSRGDDWCGTGDAQFSVTYVEGDGFTVDNVDTSAIH